MRPATTAGRAATCLWDWMSPYSQFPKTSSPKKASAARAMSSLAMASGVAASVPDAEWEDTVPCRHCLLVAPGQAYSPTVVIVGAPPEWNSGFSQPLMIGSVIPLSWSTTFVRSSAGGLLEEVEVGAEVVVVAAVGPAMPGSFSSSPPTRATTPATTAATTATAPAPSATALPRPRPGAGRAATAVVGAVACRVCAVQVVPSHQRSTVGVAGSGYQPGGVVMLIPQA